MEQSSAGIISNCADEEKLICSHGEHNTGRLKSALQNAWLLTSFPPGPQLTGKEGGRQKKWEKVWTPLDCTALSWYLAHGLCFK